MRDLRHIQSLCGVGVVLAGVILGISQSASSGQSGKAPESDLPADLTHVAPNALGFLSVRPALLWNHPAIKPTREQLSKQFPELLPNFEKAFGTALADIDRLTVVVPPQLPNPRFLVYLVTTRPFDVKKVVATVVPGAKEENRNGRRLHVAGRRAVYAIDDHAYIVGDTGDMQSIVDRGVVKEAGPLTPALRLAAGQHAAVFGGNPAPILDLDEDVRGPGIQQFLSLFEARTVSAAVDAAEPWHGVLRFSYEGETKAKEGATALHALKALAQGGLGQAIKQLGAQDKNRAKRPDALRALEASLQRANVETKGADIELAIDVKADGAAVARSLAAVVDTAPARVDRTQSVNNLKQIGLALHNFQDVYKRFPPAASYDANGKPLLSWRVFLLPFLAENALYKQFHLDEPWDSEHNKKLLDKMPRVYKAPDGQAKPGQTYYQGFHGPGAFFDGKKGLILPGDFPDGTSNTIMIVEAATPVPWTKPADVPFDPDKPVGKIGFHEGGFLAALVDASVRHISSNISAKTLKRAIIRNDGQPLGSDF